MFPSPTTYLSANNCSQYQKVPATFNLDIHDLGYLDNSPSGLKSGSTVQLPLWLAEMLALANTSTTPNMDSQSFVSLQMPPALSNSVSQAH